MNNLIKESSSSKSLLKLKAGSSFLYIAGFLEDKELLVNNIKLLNLAMKN